MSNNDDVLYNKIHELVTDKLDADGNVSDKSLQDLVTNDPNARHLYIEYVQELFHISSRFSPSNHTNNYEVDSNSASKTRLADSFSSPTNSFSIKNRFSILLTLATAAVVMFTLVPSFFEMNTSLQSSNISLATTEVATLVKLNNAVWSNETSPLKELSRLGINQELSLVEGSVELVFDSGVEALILAPCQFTIKDGGRVASNFGRISARVGENGKGFVVETPVARVTDLGTEFGVVIGDDGETDIAVFEGEVDLEFLRNIENDETSSDSKNQSLYQGQALKVNMQGSLTRISSIDDRWLPSVSQLPPIDSRLKIITSVQDNITDLDPELRSFYRIVHAGLREDGPAYVDRVHQWNSIDESGLPKALIGADYVMPFNDDKYIPELEVELDIARPATVYIFISDTVDVPMWLTDDFEDTGWDIGLDEGPGGFEGSDITLAEGTAKSIDSQFSVYKKVVLQPQKITLGGLQKPMPTKIRLDKRKFPGYNMYGIAAVAL